MENTAKTILGRSGLRVSRIGIGSSYGIGSAELEEAFERGINYFYWGTLRTSAMAEAVHHLAPRHRDQLVVAIQSYVPWPWVLRRSVERALKGLKLDYADILILGKKDEQPSPAFFDEARRLKDAGKIRFLVISAHRRPAFQQHITNPLCDIIMTRYNAAHVGAETDVFPYLPEENRPGVIAYTATRWGTLLQSTPGEKAPTASDCYRFVLRNPNVDMCLSGPANRAQLEDAFLALSAPPMTDEESEWMRRVGKIVYPQKHHNAIARRFIFD